MSKIIVLVLCNFLIVQIIGIVKSEENCDKYGVLFYEDIGCKPVKQDGKECPVRYECDNFEVSIENTNCLFRGKSFALGEKVDDDKTYPSCNVGCFCSSPGGFECAVLDCIEWLGSPILPGCYRTYDVDKCCSTGQNCQSEGKDWAHCEVDGAMLKEGQKFYPKNTCLRCVCPKNFNGKFEEPYCKRSQCNIQIRHSFQLRSKCAPFYIKSKDDVDTLCCPDEWVCPTASDKISTFTKVDNSDLSCLFGNKTLKLGEGLYSTVDYYGISQKKAKCECILPPFLTCVEVKK